MKLYFKYSLYKKRKLNFKHILYEKKRLKVKSKKKEKIVN